MSKQNSETNSTNKILAKCGDVTDSKHNRIKEKPEVPFVVAGNVDIKLKKRKLDITPPKQAGLFNQRTNMHFEKKCKSGESVTNQTTDNTDKSQLKRIEEGLDYFERLQYVDQAHLSVAETKDYIALGKQQLKLLREKQELPETEQQKLIMLEGRIDAVMDDFRSNKNIRFEAAALTTSSV